MLTLYISPFERVLRAYSYTVDNIMDNWECDLVGVQVLTKYNDGIKYLLSVIDVFSTYLQVVSVISKRGPSVTEAIQSVLKDHRYSKPVRSRLVLLQVDR